MLHPAWIEIDLDRFQKNLKVIRKRIGPTLFCLPVKADAYGHGLAEISKTAEESCVVDYLGVSCLREGVILREAGISLPIVVFGALHEDQIPDLIRHRLEVTISSRFKAELVLKECLRLQTKCPVHVEVDTGMHRTGMRTETARDLLNWMSDQKHLELVGVYSHFATADRRQNPFAFQQIEEFQRLKSYFPDLSAIWHLANSGGVMFYPESHFDMVRPGLLCYGYLPDGSQDPEILPCFSLKAKVSYFKVVGPNQGISYGHLYRTDRKTRIVTVPIGYGDGYHRSLSNRGIVSIRGKTHPIAGAICMDQLMVDVGNAEVFVGDVVTLVSADPQKGPSLEQIAHLANTIPYEMLCSFHGRLMRKYVGSISQKSEKSDMS